MTSIATADTAEPFHLLSHLGKTPQLDLVLQGQLLQLSDKSIGCIFGFFGVCAPYVQHFPQHMKAAGLYSESCDSLHIAWPDVWESLSYFAPMPPPA